eukprot:GHVT01065563.1.p1 GENE.GHVT01065563.1~~GHVT01065563.1.p1  ORF type:complete len:490 (+),score=145.54 GHVT01065563.1:876-2345(+)
MKERTMEESKYLGGDVEHTHLVKGLDFALLTKVRSELGKEAVETEKKSKEVARQRQAVRQGVRKVDTELGRQMLRVLFERLHPHHLAFRDKLRRLETVILQASRVKDPVETFGPGRTQFLFDLSSSSSCSSPTIVLHSKDEAAGVAAALDADVVAPAQIHYKLRSAFGSAMDWHRENKKKKKQDRLPRRPGAMTSTDEASGQSQSAHVQSVAADDSKDIFEDAGVFLPTDVGDASGAGHERAAAKADGRYFEEEAGPGLPTPTDAHGDIIREEEGMELDESHVRMYATQPLHAFPAGVDANSAMAAVFGLGATGAIADEPAIGKLRVGNRQLHPGPSSLHATACSTSFEASPSASASGAPQRRPAPEEPASYLECYPSIGGGTTMAAYDSDDEDVEDRSKMDSGRQKPYGARRRDDFESHKDWEEYQLAKEALPKAAFQYGKKVAEERTTRRKKKPNLDQEWKQIEKMITERSTLDIGSIGKHGKADQD